MVHKWFLHVIHQLAISIPLFCSDAHHYTENRIIIFRRWLPNGDAHKLASDSELTLMKKLEQCFPSHSLFWGWWDQLFVGSREISDAHHHHRPSSLGPTGALWFLAHENLEQRTTTTTRCSGSPDGKELAPKIQHHLNRH